MPSIHVSGSDSETTSGPPIGLIIGILVSLCLIALISSVIFCRHRGYLHLARKRIFEVAQIIGDRWPGFWNTYFQLFNNLYFYLLSALLPQHIFRIFRFRSSWSCQHQQIKMVASTVVDEEQYLDDVCYKQLWKFPPILTAKDCFIMNIDTIQAHGKIWIVELTPCTNII